MSEISIHALLAESDDKSNKLAGRKLVFLSTLSLRRATTDGLLLLDGRKNFYPRSPCGERRCYSIRHSAQDGYFYPRSPCGERRIKPIFRKINTRDFYPRSPCGERHNGRMRDAENLTISIHALLAESDTRQNQNL